MLKKTFHYMIMICSYIIGFGSAGMALWIILSTEWDSPIFPAVFGGFVAVNLLATHLLNHITWKNVRANANANAKLKSLEVDITSVMLEDNGK